MRTDAERDARVAADEALAVDIERDGVDAFLARWLAQPMFASIPAGRTGIDERRRLRPEYLTACLRVLGTGAMEPLWDRLPELEMPVLIVTGTRRCEVRRDRTRDGCRDRRERRVASDSTVVTRCCSNAPTNSRDAGRRVRARSRLVQHQSEREERGEDELEARGADQRGDERRRVVIVPHELDRADRERRGKQREQRGRREQRARDDGDSAPTMHTTYIEPRA